ncbi:ATP-binding protein [Patescibacteria group bacterium]|nr:ATP-binding protein [Patescibacteria group bacterium]
MKARSLCKVINRAIKTFPVIVITGPRQSGKTTLVKSLQNKKYTYVNLEDINIRTRAKSDPVSFLDQYKRPLIIDEVQYVPELLSYIKLAVDENRKAGQWILTGSQNFVLMKGVSESLAGRAAILSLLPFSLAERIGFGDKTRLVNEFLKKPILNQSLKKKVSISELILRGNYPEIANNKRVDRQLWCASYINTYLERDIRNLTQVGDLNQFERFLRLCATRTGQILNISEIGKEIGVAVNTAKRWLSLLETGYQIYLLYPYYKNIGKRLIKSPKLYFIDTGLASFLLGLHDRQTLLNSPSFPHLFETFVIVDFWKRFFHGGQMPSMYYLRTRDGLEVDLVIEEREKLHFFEIKSSMTALPKYADSLLKAKSGLGKLVEDSAVLSRSEESFELKKGIKNYSWLDVLSK